MNIQALIDGLSAQWQKERSETQMTLGKLISELEKLPPGAEVENLNNLHSYRGFYCDLAFEKEEGFRLASELLSDCKNAMGKIFEGYKGGDYLMGETTPIWISAYGCGGGLAIFGLNENGTFIAEYPQESAP